MFFFKTSLSPLYLVQIKNLLHQYFLFRFGYPHAKFQNNPVIFIDLGLKIGQLGYPKPHFFSLDQKTYFTNIFYLG